MAATEVVREGDNDDDAQHRLDNRRASKELLEVAKGHNGLHKEEAKDAADWCPGGILAGKTRIRESREGRGSAPHYQCQGRCVDNDTQTAIKEKCEAMEKRMGEASTDAEEWKKARLVHEKRHGTGGWDPDEYARKRRTSSSSKEWDTLQLAAGWTMYEEDRESSDLEKNKPIKVFEFGNRRNILPGVILEVVRARHVEELRKKLQAERTKNGGEPPACTDPESAGTGRICAHAHMWATTRRRRPAAANQQLPEQIEEMLRPAEESGRDPGPTPATA